MSRKQIKQQRKQAKLHKRGKLDKKRRQAHAHRDARGQVHLELHRDPLSGNAQVVLRQAIFEHAWQNQLAVATATTAHTLLQPEPTLEQVAELARNVMGATSRLAEGLLTRAPAGSVACKAGCDHCCYQPVGVTAPEALAIFDHLKQTRSVEALAQLTAHVAKRHEQTRDLSAAERFSPEQPCPFLESGHCSVYEVRPLACRGMNSLDADDCADRLRDPEARATFLAKGFGGRSFMEPIRGFHAVSAGLQLALTELYHLDMRPLDLTAAMHLLLSGSDALPDEWLSGRAPFATARGADNTAQPGIRELTGALEPKPSRH